MVREIEENAYYRVEISEAVENNGYYRNMPEIYAQLKIGIVKYQIRSDTGSKVKGELRLGRQSITESIRGDGRYTLNMWAEDSMGNILGESSCSQKFIVDSRTQEDAIRFVWDKVTRRMEITGRDKLSGVSRLSYRIGNGEEIHTKDQEVFLMVPEDFTGDITATLVDGAGNQCAAKYKVERQTSPSQAQASQPNELQPPASQPAVSPPPPPPQSDSDPDTSHMDAPISNNNAGEDTIQNQVRADDETNDGTREESIADTMPPRIVNITELREKITQFAGGNDTAADMDGFDIETYIEDDSLYFCEYVEKDGGIELQITDDFGNQTIEHIPIKVDEENSVWIWGIPIFLLFIAVFAWKLCRRGLY